MNCLRVEDIAAGYGCLRLSIFDAQVVHCQSGRAQLRRTIYEKVRVVTGRSLPKCRDYGWSIGENHRAGHRNGANRIVAGIATVLRKYFAQCRNTTSRTVREYAPKNLNADLADHSSRAARGQRYRAPLSAGFQTSTGSAGRGSSRTRNLSSEATA